MDYIFFDDALQGRFTDRLTEQGIAWEGKPDRMEGYVISIPDDLSDEVMDGLEAYYDELLDEQAVLAETRDGWVNKRLAGVQSFLPDGRECTIALPPELANRLLAHFSAEEVAALVGAVVDSLSQDFNGPLCKHPLGKP